jgi:hypothetical protein
LFYLFAAVSLPRRVIDFIVHGGPMMHPCRLLPLLCLLCLPGGAFAWGPEGHSIVAEIAQRRLSPDAAAIVEKLLGRGHSLASVASWADDVRDERPDTYNWHFADIPVVSKQYVEGRDCQPDKAKGDCAVNELGRLKDELHCKTGAEQVEALKYAVHFVGDIHQPMHTVGDAKGANEIQVDIFMRGKTCLGTCKPDHMPKNLHAAWDSELIKKVVWDWGASVDRLEEGEGWLKSQEAQKSGIDGGTPAEWAEETHRFARQVWELLPADNVLGDAYLRDALPIMDRQLGVAGLRLARFLNEAYASDAPACQPHQP